MVVISYSFAKRKNVAKKKNDKVTIFMTYSAMLQSTRSHLQCDQMAILLLNLCPFKTMVICHVAQKCQSWYKGLPNAKKAIQKIAQRLLKISKVAKFRQIWSH